MKKFLLCLFALFLFASLSEANGVRAVARVRQVNVVRAPGFRAVNVNIGRGFGFNRFGFAGYNGFGFNRGFFGGYNTFGFNRFGVGYSGFGIGAYAPVQTFGAFAGACPTVGYAPPPVTFAAPAPCPNAYVPRQLFFGAGVGGCGGY